MSWDRKPNTGKSYYYRNKRVDGRPVKEYVGRGAKGEQAAQRDEEERLQRQLDRQHWLVTLARVEEAGEPVKQLFEVTTRLTRSVLVAFGFYLHKGHEWRRRGPRNHG